MGWVSRPNTLTHVACPFVACALQGEEEATQPHRTDQQEGGEAQVVDESTETDDGTIAAGGAQGPTEGAGPVDAGPAGEPHHRPASASTQPQASTSRPVSARPASARPTSARPVSARPQSGSARPPSGSAPSPIPEATAEDSAAGGESSAADMQDAGAGEAAPEQEAPQQQRPGTSQGSQRPASRPSSQDAAQRRPSSGNKQQGGMPMVPEEQPLQPAHIEQYIAVGLKVRACTRICMRQEAPSPACMHAGMQPRTAARGKQTPSPPPPEAGSKNIPSCKWIVGSAAAAVARQQHGRQKQLRFSACSGERHGPFACHTSTLLDRQAGVPPGIPPTRIRTYVYVSPQIQPSR